MENSFDGMQDQKKVTVGSQQVLWKHEVMLT